MIRSILLAFSLLSTAAAVEVADLITLYPANGAALPQVREGTPFAATLTLTNPFDRAIRIVGTDSTCVCNVLEVANDFLLPGESTTVAFETVTANKSGETTQRLWFYPSDTAYESLEIRVSWEVLPLVTVDVLPPDQRSPERPEAVAWRDIYQLTAHEQPEDFAGVQKNLLVATSEAEMPADGFSVTAIDYEGDLWAITSRRIDNLKTLILLRAAEREGLPAQGDYSETFTIHTNHPDKAAIEIELLTSIDPNAGAPANPLDVPPPPGFP